MLFRSSSGTDIAFDATIDSEKKIITINPNSDFSSEQVIMLLLAPQLKMMLIMPSARPQ